MPARSGYFYIDIQVTNDLCAFEKLESRLTLESPASLSPRSSNEFLLNRSSLGRKTSFEQVSSRQLIKRELFVDRLKSLEIRIISRFFKGISISRIFNVSFNGFQRKNDRRKRRGGKKNLILRKRKYIFSPQRRIFRGKLATSSLSSFY